jgi:hypothetical protein
MVEVGVGQQNVIDPVKPVFDGLLVKIPTTINEDVFSPCTNQNRGIRAYISRVRRHAGWTGTGNHRHPVAGTGS